MAIPSWIQYTGRRRGKTCTYNAGNSSESLYDLIPSLYTCVGETNNCNLRILNDISYTMQEGYPFQNDYFSLIYSECNLVTNSYFSLEALEAT